MGSTVTSALLVLVSLNRYRNLCPMPRNSSPALASLASKRKQGHCARWRPPGARLVSIVTAHVTGTSQGLPCLDLSAPREPAWRGRSRGGLVSSASRGLAPREGLECLLVKMGCTGPLAKPRAVGRRQASLGTPVPRMPTVAPGPNARSDLASRRSQRASAECRGPQQPASLGAAWRLIGRWHLRFPTLPWQLPDLTSPYCMQKDSSLPAIMEADGWPPLGYK